MSTTYRSATKRLLVGRKITAVELNRFSDGRGGWTTDPTIFLDNGKRLRFNVHETEVGKYGIEITVIDDYAITKGDTK